MSLLHVLRCGPGLSVQDAGRVGFRRYGVSTAGAMDQSALALANSLVGNALDTAAIEIPLLGASFRFAGGATLVAAVGAGARLAVNGRAVAPAASASLQASDEIEVGSAQNGVYTYLAVAGGLDVPSTMDSQSLHQRTGLGPPPIEAGDWVTVGADGNRKPRRFDGVSAPGAGPIRVVPGPQEAYFGASAWETFLSHAFEVGLRSDRMGLRLEGSPLTSDAGYDIVSEGVVPGSIQVPGDGRPIVLGRDCQTTGGYPKIATVISADLGRLAQTRPGSALRFRTVSVEEAREAARKLSRWRGGLGAAVLSATSGSGDLLRHNLIDGVTRGDH